MQHGIAKQNRTPIFRQSKGLRQYHLMAGDWRHCFDFAVLLAPGRAFPPRHCHPYFPSDADGVANDDDAERHLMLLYWKSRCSRHPWSKMRKDIHPSCPYQYFVVSDHGVSWISQRLSISSRFDGGARLACYSKQQLMKTIYLKVALLWPRYSGNWPRCWARDYRQLLMWRATWCHRERREKGVKAMFQWSSIRAVGHETRFSVVVWYDSKSTEHHKSLCGYRRERERRTKVETFSLLSIMALNRIIVVVLWVADSIPITKLPPAFSTKKSAYVSKICSPCALSPT